MICADFMLVNCRGVQQCSMQLCSTDGTTRGTDDRKKQSLAHFNVYWLIRIRGIVVFSISVSSKLFPV